MSFKFILLNKEITEFREWQIGHRKDCPVDNVGAIGGRFTYSFTPTGLGDIIRIKCACGEELDLTHSERW
jgi:hypothetical protein